MVGISIMIAMVIIVQLFGIFMTNQSIDSNIDYNYNHRKSVTRITFDSSLLLQHNYQNKISSYYDKGNKKVKNKKHVFSYDVLIIGIVSYDGYNLAKYLIQNISRKIAIIGIDNFDTKNGVFLQRQREQELIRMSDSITIIRGNICDYKLLLQIIDDNKYIQLIINAYNNNNNNNNDCFVKLSIQKLINGNNDTIIWKDSKSLIDDNHSYLYSINKYKNNKKIKKYLLMSTFYIYFGDPMHGKNKIEFHSDSYWCKKFIRPWYDSFKNNTFKDIKNIDIVIIHDGLKNSVFQYYTDIIFVNMGQYPLKYDQIRPSANDIRYYHMFRYLNKSNINEYELIIITDLRDVKFGKNPFKYLLNKINNNNDIYVGSELDKDINKTLHWRWSNWVQDRMDKCFNKQYVENTNNWLNSKNGINLNPGIIGTNKQTLMKLFNLMINIFDKTNKRKDNCNFAVYQIAIYTLCVAQNQCELFDDDKFHSPFGLNLDPLKSDYVIYHK